MKTDEIVMNWYDIKDYLNPSIRKQFEIDTEDVDISKYRIAEQNVTAELRFYIPCFDKKSRGLNRIWASIFDFTFIGEANEKSEKSYEQITTNYNKAMEFLQSDEAKNYCKSNLEDDLSASSFMRFGKLDVIKF